MTVPDEDWHDRVNRDEDELRWFYNSQPSRAERRAAEQPAWVWVVQGVWSYGGAEVASVHLSPEGAAAWVESQTIREQPGEDWRRGVGRPAGVTSWSTPRDGGPCWAYRRKPDGLSWGDGFEITEHAVVG